MAQIWGEPGRYVQEQATQKVLRLVFGIYLIGIVIGFASGLVLNIRNAVFSLIVLLILYGVWRLFKKQIKKVETDRLNFRKGLSGEVIIGDILNGLSDDFRVIHDLSTPAGNIDHVVIGPTGIYAIDAKNWKGVVSANGNGELLINGKPTKKPEIKNIIHRIMTMRKKVMVLSSLKDPYIQCVFAFPSAHVKAKWGETSAVHCLRDEQLYDYIVNNKKHTKLSNDEIETLSRAFLALARMDKEFGSDGASL